MKGSAKEPRRSTDASDYQDLPQQIGAMVKTFADGKLSKLAKFLDEPIEIHLTLERVKRSLVAELHVTHRHGILDAKEESEQTFDAIQAVADKVEKQARRSRKKHNDKKRRAGRPATEDGWNWPVEVLEAASLSTPTGPRVLKTGKLPIQPMTIDEASQGLESSKNEFYVFRDTSTDRVSVLYRRDDGNYGLIAPEF